ncbi:hypothetical protein RRG08_007653 [Elysia crispata]|uniref:Uncharacterized protein n=1 Tax=Elysia crispata TaxID=231223 RepID=A0AAE1CS05_9GAST|nr:hypothetical protein RRG08_007653 [Elysia crispata]
MQISTLMVLSSHADIYSNGFPLDIFPDSSLPTCRYLSRWFSPHLQISIQMVLSPPPDIYPDGSLPTSRYLPRWFSPYSKYLSRWFSPHLQIQGTRFSALLQISDFPNSVFSPPADMYSYGSLSLLAAIFNNRFSPPADITKSERVSQNRLYGDGKSRLFSSK